MHKRNIVQTWGSDPEMMIRDRKSGEVVSAIEILNYHGKEDKIDLGDEATFYYDNVNCEFNIKPARTRDECLSHCFRAFNGAAQVLDKKYELVPKSSHTFEEKHLNHPDARVAGCSPQYSAVKLEMINPPDLTGNGFRSCGKHIHLGRADWQKYENKDNDGEPFLDPWSKIRLIKMMDYFVGLTSVVIDRSPESLERKRIYGGEAGLHRISPFGCEYRNPSNYAATSPIIVGLFYDMTNDVGRLEIEGKAEDFLKQLNQDDVCDAMSRGDEILALNLLNELKIDSKYMKIIEQLANKPIHYDDFYQNWGIKAA